MSLFDQPTLNIASDLKHAMHAAVKNSNLSREEVVDKMNALADRYGVRMVSGNSQKLNMSTFEKWLNPDDDSRLMPLRALPVFCAVVECPEIIGLFARPLGYEVIGPEEVSMLKWAKAYFSQRKAAKEMRELEKAI